MKSPKKNAQALEITTLAIVFCERTRDLRRLGLPISIWPNTLTIRLGQSNISIYFYIVYAAARFLMAGYGGNPCGLKLFSSLDAWSTVDLYITH